MASISVRKLVTSGLGIVMASISGSLMSDTRVAEPDGNRECVVLLHGLARSKFSMAKLESRLQEIYQVVNQTYPSRNHPIQELAGLAIPPSLEACGKTNKIHFVTHSLGGILVRQYLANHKIENLGNVVMLGPPNQGSELVDYFGDNMLFKNVNGPTGLQLGTGDSSLPKSLGKVDFSLGVIAGDKNYSPFFARVIGSPNDGKVSVQSSKVEGMKDHLVLPVTHTFMMRNEKVIEQVKWFLKHQEFKR